MAVFHVQFVLGVCYSRTNELYYQNASMSVFHVQFVLGVCSSRTNELYYQKCFSVRVSRAVRAGCVLLQDQ